MVWKSLLQECAFEKFDNKSDIFDIEESLRGEWGFDGMITSDWDTHGRHTDIQMTLLFIMWKL